MEKHSSAICVKTDKETKEKFTEICAGMGLTVSSAISIFVATVIKKKGIPFSLDLKDN